MAESNVYGPFERQNWQCACAVSRDRVVGVIRNHIWNQRPQFAYSLYNFYGATTHHTSKLKYTSEMLLCCQVQSDMWTGPRRLNHLYSVSTRLHRTRLRRVSIDR